MASILRAASGVASRCGSNVPLRAAAAVAALAATWWAGSQLWGWAASHTPGGLTGLHPGPYFLAAIVSVVYIIGSLVNLAIMSDPPHRWTLDTMTGYAPFVVWRTVISDGRVTAWKLLLWPLLVPAEALTCLWLAIGWLVRLLNIDLSKR